MQKLKNASSEPQHHMTGSAVRGDTEGPPAAPPRWEKRAERRVKQGFEERRGEGFGISRAVQSLPAEAVCVFPNSADLGGASSGEGSGASRAGTCTHPVSHRVCTAETWLVG